LGIGDWGLGPIPNPQSPIPNPQSPKFNLYYLKNKYLLILILESKKLSKKNINKINLK
jgi:hypothetical protein